MTATSKRKFQLCASGEFMEFMKEHLTDLSERGRAAIVDDKDKGAPMKRISKTEYFLNIAQDVAARGTCLRRNFGAVIVNTSDQIVSTGYTGAPVGRENCCDLGRCRRQELGVAPGERYELCRSMHAEMNACIQANRDDMVGATLYLCGLDAQTGEIYPGTDSCEICKRAVINARIAKVVVRQGERISKEIPVDLWVKNEPLPGYFV